MQLVAAVDFRKRYADTIGVTTLHRYHDPHRAGFRLDRAYGIEPMDRRAVDARVSDDPDGPCSRDRVPLRHEFGDRSENPRGRAPSAAAAARAILSHPVDCLGGQCRVRHAVIARLSLQGIHPSALLPEHLAARTAALLLR